MFNEAEAANKRELDDGELGTERKLYYREMIARFGHHLALEWNLCEEYNLNFDFGPERIARVCRLHPRDRPLRSSDHGAQRRRSGRSNFASPSAIRGSA